jgi:4-aminobutyrate aminotransferase/(S)-3-amino-2-methylpropionate transaminase
MATTDPPFGEHLPRGLYTFHPIVVREGRGSRVLDEGGREFLDLTSGLGVLHVGHNHPALLEAMEGQLHALLHMCSHVMLHRPYLDLAQRLNGFVPVPDPCKTFLCNSGAEAVENAVKIARYATGRRTVVAFHGGYHGRTLLCTSLTSRSKPYRKGFAPLAPEVRHIPYAYCYRCAWKFDRPACPLRCLEEMERLFFMECPAEEVAAVVVEPIQGEGGVVDPPDGFLIGLQRICRKNGILLIADEIQTGLGRTGRPLAVQHSGMEPDLVVLGKALGGGLPLAAVTGRAEVMDSVHRSGLGSTFGGNPVACAAALRLLDILEKEELSARAQEIEERIRAREWQDRYPFIGDVRGRGAMLGIELVKDPATREPAVSETRKAVRRAFEKGVLLISGGLYRNVIRLLPALNIPWEELDKGLDVLEASLNESGA